MRYSDVEGSFHLLSWVTSCAELNYEVLKDSKYIHKIGALITNIFEEEGNASSLMSLEKLKSRVGLIMAFSYFFYIIFLLLMSGLNPHQKYFIKNENVS